MEHALDLSFLPVAPIALAAAFALTAVAALLQGSVGFGFGVLSVPVLSLIDPALAPVPQLLVALPMTVTMVLRERHAVELKGVAWVLIGRLPGAALGVLLLKLADARVLDMAIAFVVLTAVGIIASGAKVKRNRRTELAAGVASGAFGLVAAISGPPLALLYREASGAAIRANLALVFSIGILITVAARSAVGAITTRDVQIAIYLLPALLGGLYMSRRLAGRIEGRPLRIAILIVAGLSAAGLLLRAAALWTS